MVFVCVSVRSFFSSRVCLFFVYTVLQYCSGSGSDAAALVTTARKDGESQSYSLNVNC